MNETTDGVWVAYYYDRSDAVPFKEEIDALRYAVSNSPMNVRFVKFGESIFKEKP